MTLLANVTLPGRRGRFDVRCEQGSIAGIAPHRAASLDSAAVDGGGGALLPGLHDHHVHLCALAAARASVACGPDVVADAPALRAALAGAPGSGWVRGVGYHESVAGPLDRWRLDAWLPHRPLRLQHRSGKLWLLNSAALQRLGIADCATLPGIERDAAGRPTGRLFRCDKWLGARLAACGERTAPDLASLSGLFASRGVTGVTDATPDNGPQALGLFEAAAQRGHWRLHLRLMGSLALPLPGHPRLSRGQYKILLDEDALPAWDLLSADIARAHCDGRGVAVHCVTPAELVFALCVLRDVGVHALDRIEHASLVPAGVLPLLLETGVTVVTQPNFIAERGAQYRREVPQGQHGDLYRGHTLRAAGIPLAGSTDAPYGAPDPWAAMRAAVSRRTPDGALLGAGEALTPEQALALFGGAADHPGGPVRRVVAGAPADLCLLALPWSRARWRLRAADVLATVVCGEIVYRRAAAVVEGARVATV